ncbi:MAG: hypothetical protein KY468_10190 [Armatimonadetes bacterium]|nr:hypothetical protein [Armatimonadota bacterium]
MSDAVPVCIYQIYDPQKQEARFSFRPLPGSSLVMETQVERLDDLNETAFIRGYSFDPEHLFTFFRDKKAWLAAYPYWEYEAMLSCGCGPIAAKEVDIKTVCAKCGRRPSPITGWRKVAPGGARSPDPEHPAGPTDP